MRKITVAAVRRRLSRGRVEIGQWIAGTGSRRTEHFAASFTAWLKRSEGHMFKGFPDQWRQGDGPEIEKAQRVAVVMHVFYRDLVPELLEQLENIPVDFDLIVTNSSGEPLELPTVPARASSTRIFTIENHGRDIYPLLAVVNARLLDDYDLVLKVHTKRSPWREQHSGLAGSGLEWKDAFIEGLLGTTENVERILGEFASDPLTGVVTADGSVLGDEFWGGDRQIADALLRRLELTVEGRDLRFPSGSMYWVRAFVLQGLRALCVERDDFEDEAGQVDGTTAHAIERIIGIVTEEAGYVIRERSELDATTVDSDAWTEFAGPHTRQPAARIVPLYLPQFHAFPENDLWWGTGFTEWTNVTVARPVLEGHNQPLLPGDLGYYNLLSDDVRARQRELAVNAGIDGFMYYYYWFAGRRIMSKPLELLIDSELDQPFCLMWANENWTRKWDGRESDILIGQDYDTVPAENFIDDIMPFLKDPRYMRIDGKAILAVYRIAQIPNYEDVIVTWRERAREAGVGELELLTVDVSTTFDGLDGHHTEAGMDGLLEFPPHNQFWEWLPHSGLGVDRRFRGNVLSYRAMVEDSERKHGASIAPDVFPGAMVNFDNTARRQWTPEIWYGANPYTFRRWLASLTLAVADREPSRRLVVINAWNEWAEGAVLEPSQRFGSTYLLAVRDVTCG